MRIPLVVAALALPGVAFAQEASKSLDRPRLTRPDGGWTVTWAASADQSFTLDEDAQVLKNPADIQDEGEYTAGVSFERDLAGIASIAFTPELTLSPNLFDDDDEEGVWSFATKVSRKLPMTSTGTPPDSFLPFVSYKISEAYPRFSDDERSDEQTLTAGLRFTNIIGILNGEKGTYYDVTLSYSEVNASDNDDDRSGPKLSFEWARPHELEWRPSYWDALPVFAEASVERRDYDTLLADSGGAAQADRYSAMVGVNLTRWAKAHLRFEDGMEFKVGIRYLAVESNRSVLETEEWSFVPTISWERED